MILGCLIEFQNAAFCIWDDMTDSSETRRNKPCWYRREGVGLTAINDGCLLRSYIHVILKHRFRDHPAYLDSLELFAEMSLHTEMGQYLDTMATTHALKVHEFTWDLYGYIVENKTSYYTFYLPMAIPMLYLGVANPKWLSEIYNAAKALGMLFQARDDFLDVYGDPNVTGKVGTDFQENKCSWLFVTALQYCSDEQKEVLERCYGKKHSADVARIKALFDELNPVQRFQRCDQQMMAEARAMFQGASDVRLKEAFSLTASKGLKDPRRGVARPVS